MSKDLFMTCACPEIHLHFDLKNYELKKLSCKPGTCKLWWQPLGNTMPILRLQLRLHSRMGRNDCFEPSIQANTSKFQLGASTIPQALQEAELGNELTCFTADYQHFQQYCLRQNWKIYALDPALILQLKGSILI